MALYYRILTIVALSSFFCGGHAQGQDTVPAIYKIDLQREIGASTWIYTQKGFEQAAEHRASAVLIHMNTYGGEVVYADSIRTKILNARVPVYVFVDNNAASAGALIAIACDKIYMREGAAIGAATVVDQTGDKMPDKYQSYMRATMRATAEAKGRDPLIAEAMVDERTVVPHVNDSGKVLTFSTREAMRHGYCDGMAESVEEVIEQQLGYDKYELLVFEPTAWDEVKGFFMSSVIQGLLIMLIVGGIYFELQTPGIGFPLGVAVLAAVLYFVPLYIDGLAANWEILLFIIGIGLIALELFVIPGFGVAGVSGIVLLTGGLVLAMLENDIFNFKPVAADAVGGALLTVAVGLLSGFGLVVWLSSKIGTKGMFRKVALQATLDKAEGYVGVSMEGHNLIGKQGTARTVLRPSGKVEVDGTVYDAVSEQGFVEQGTPVTVVRHEAGQIYVTMDN